MMADDGLMRYFSKTKIKSHFLFWGCLKIICFSCLSPSNFTFLLNSLLNLFNELSEGRFCPGTGIVRIQKKVVCLLKEKERVNLHCQRPCHFIFKKKGTLSICVNLSSTTLPNKI